MTSSTHESLAGHGGALVVHTWERADPRWVAVLAHGYGEHLGRYDHVAAALGDANAAVVGPDHVGHGRSEGERVSIADFQPVVDDLHAVVTAAQSRYERLPIVMVGHSMGGMIAARYAQQHGDDLNALVLSGPVLGSWAATAMADLDEIPDDPLDVSTLSRDPAVGEAYAADPLVWHGPFKRETLLALRTELDRINDDGDLADLPTLWVHGADDPLVPIDATRAGIERIRGTDLTERIFPGARHEVFNETNRDEVLGTVVDFAGSHV